MPLLNRLDAAFSGSDYHQNLLARRKCEELGEIRMPEVGLPGGRRHAWPDVFFADVDDSVRHSATLSVALERFAK